MYEDALESYLEKLSLDMLSMPEAGETDRDEEETEEDSEKSKKKKSSLWMRKRWQKCTAMWN